MNKLLSSSGLFTLTTLGLFLSAMAHPATAARFGSATPAQTIVGTNGPLSRPVAALQTHGTPGAGMRCDLSVLEGDKFRPLKTVTTAENGRTAEPLLVDEALKAGRYELLLYFEEYFQKWKAQLPTPNFLKTVPVRFVIQDTTQRYHLPILFTPWGYSYYRGS